MAGQTKDVRLNTKSARADNVKPNRIGWHVLVPGKLSLGYKRRRGATGQWLVREYTGRDIRTRPDGTTKEQARYRVRVLGLADDLQEADGDVFLDYDQAEAAARSLAGNQKRKTTSFTVADACELYLAHCYAKTKASAPDIGGRMRRDILPKIGDLAISTLERDNTPLEKWLADMASTPVRYRGGKVREIVTDEQARARKASANKSRTILISALNHAIKKKKIATDEAWATFEPFEHVDEARLVYYEPDEMKRLLEASDKASGFADLVLIALSTGMRYGELTRLTVGDYNKGALYIGKSKSGHTRHVALPPEVARYVEAELIPNAIDGVLLPNRRHGRAWKKSEQARAFNLAKKAAGITRGSFHALRHSYASALASKNVSLLVIAGLLGHRSTRMTERYAHMSKTAAATAVEQFAPRLLT